jgi:branched-chain amino acid transport system ATP-binding protein
VLFRSKDSKVSMLIVEQNVTAALGISDYGYVMENGRIVLNGPAEKLKDNEDVKEFYMGISTHGGQKNYRDIKHYRRRKRWLS